MNGNDGLYEKLKRHGEEDYLPMHMPGHKRNAEFLNGLPVDIDITEIEGFDNLHDMDGVLLDTAKRAAALYGAHKCYPLVNGSSAGILAAVTAATRGKGRLLMSRNCHKSAYNAAVINRLETSYLYPKTDETGIMGEISPEDVKTALEVHRDVTAVLITSPTFEGVVSDIEKIAEICHEKNVPLIVDTAHGAHFGFDASFPQNPVRQGADYVIMSLHKTLPALTQCALLATSQNADEGLCAYALSIYETTSPSYILMAAIDECIRVMENKSKELFYELNENLRRFYESTRLKTLKIKHYDDPSRIIVDCSCADVNGTQLSKILRDKFKIEIEMAYADYAVLITTVCDNAQSFERLSAALIDIDGRLGKKTPQPIMRIPAAAQQMPMYAAAFEKSRHISVRDCEGKICAENVFAYPPGIPIAAPGELITRETAQFIALAPQRGIELHGSRCSESGKIAVL